MQNKLSRRSFLARGAAGVSLFLLSGALFAKYETETSAASNAVGRNVSGFDEGELAGDRATLTINGAEFAFRYCPAGEFLMGSPLSEKGRESDETQHKVVLTKAYWLMETELTQAQWEAITGENPSYFTGENLPVESVSWNDCEAFVNKLNEELKAAPEGWRFSLPTEAQWEYACRAGTTAAFSFGDSLNGDNANCDGNYPYGTRTKGPYLEKTSPVRSYASNAWGLYDMHGNVWEWCKDRYGVYPTGGVKDPKGLVAGSDRVRRGGCWSSYAGYCRSANRNRDDADGRFIYLGARLALVSTSD